MSASGYDSDDYELRQSLAEFGSPPRPPSELESLPSELEEPESSQQSTKEISLEEYLREFVLARSKIACPDCDIRGDLSSHPDVNSGKPLKVRPGKHGSVKRCATCKGRAYEARGEATKSAPKRAAPIAHRSLVTYLVNGERRTYRLLDVEKLIQEHWERHARRRFRSDT